jgi:hypothetical protein
MATNGEGDDDDAVYNVPTGGTVAGSSSVASAGVGGGGGLSVLRPVKLDSIMFRAWSRQGRPKKQA